MKLLVKVIAVLAVVAFISGCDVGKEKVDEFIHTVYPDGKIVGARETDLGADYYEYWICLGERFLIVGVDGTDYPTINRVMLFPSSDVQCVVK